LITSSVVLKLGYNGLAYSIVILWLVALCIMMSIPDAKKSSKSTVKKLKLSDAKILFENDKYKLLILIMICMFCLNTANLIVAVDKMMALGATATEVGYKFSITGLIELPLYFAGAYFIGRFKEYRLLIISAVTLTVQFLLFAIATTPMQIVFITGLQFIHGPFLNMAAKSLIYKYSDVNLKSTGQLVAVSIYGGIAGLMVPVVAGAVTDRFNVNTTLYGTVFIGIIGVFLSLILYKKGNTVKNKKLSYVLEK
jgi:cyanate permease